MRGRSLTVLLGASFFFVFAEATAMAGSLADFDGDGVPDESDNCLEAPNPDQTDSDGDLCGNACDADYNDDGIVGLTDFNLFRQGYITSSGDPDWNPDLDFNADGVVGVPDYNFYRSRYGTVPGPSGTTPGTVACPLPPV